MERAFKLRADEIKRLMLARGLSVRQLAKEAGVDVKSLRRWLKGNPAFLSGARALALALKTNVQNLLDGFQPVYVGVSPAPEEKFRMTFSVESNRPFTPEDIEYLCKSFDKVARDFLSSLPTNIPIIGPLALAISGPPRPPRIVHCCRVGAFCVYYASFKDELGPVDEFGAFRDHRLHVQGTSSAPGSWATG